MNITEPLVTGKLPFLNTFLTFCCPFCCKMYGAMCFTNTKPNKTMEVPGTFMLYSQNLMFKIGVPNHTQF